MIERPNPHELRDDYVTSEAIRLATFRQSELTRGGYRPPFQPFTSDSEAIEAVQQETHQ